MSKIKTNLKEVLGISPFLWEYQSNQEEVKKYTLQLIHDGLEASEVVHQVRIWLSNNRKPIDSSQPPTNKIDYVGYHSVRTNAGGGISLKDTLKLPPYRRGETEKKSKENQDKPQKTTIKIANESSQFRDWLTSLEETKRTLFINWCIKQGKIASKILWAEFNTEIDTTIATPTFEQRSYVEDGWALKKVRKSQGHFRQDVLRNWNNKCAITGSAFALEACHIINHALQGVPSVENGIALAADLHCLLDSGHLKIIDNHAIFSEEARKDLRYASYHNNELSSPIVPIKT